MRVDGDRWPGFHVYRGPERRSRKSRLRRYARWQAGQLGHALRYPHRNAVVLGWGAIGTGLVLFTSAVQESVARVGMIPSATVGTILVLAGLVVVVFNHTHQAIAVSGLVVVGGAVGVLLWAFTLSAFDGRTSGLALPLVAAYLGLCATTAADLLSEWGERINTSTTGD